MKELMELLRDVNDGIDYMTVKDLVTGGYFTSLDLLTIIAEIEDRFMIELSPTEIVPSNFESIEAIWNLVSGKMMHKE